MNSPVKGQILGFVERTQIKTVTEMMPTDVANIVSVLILIWPILACYREPLLLKLISILVDLHLLACTNMKSLTLQATQVSRNSVHCGQGCDAAVRLAVAIARNLRVAILTWWRSVPDRGPLALLNGNSITLNHTKVGVLTSLYPNYLIIPWRDKLFIVEVAEFITIL